MLERMILQLLIVSIFANIILTTIAFVLIIALTIKYIKESRTSATD